VTAARAPESLHTRTTGRKPSLRSPSVMMDVCVTRWRPWVAPPALEQVRVEYLVYLE
jgi:hypothetical protein